MPKRKSMMEPDQILVMQGETSTPELRGFLRQQGVFIPPSFSRSGALAFLGERLLSRQQGWQGDENFEEEGGYPQEEAGFEQNQPYAAAPPSAPAPPANAPGFGQSNAPSFGQASEPGFGQGSEPGFGQASAPGFGQGNAPGFGQASEPGFGQASEPGFGQGTSSGFGRGSDSGFGLNQSSDSGFGLNQSSDSGFGLNQSDSGFGRGSDSGFGLNQSSDSGFGLNQSSDSGSPWAPQEKPTGAFPPVGSGDETRQVPAPKPGFNLAGMPQDSGDSTTQAAHRVERLDLSEWGYLVRVVLIADESIGDPAGALYNLRPTVGSWLVNEIPQPARLEYDRRFRRELEKRLARFLTESIGRFPVIKTDIQYIE